MTSSKLFSLAMSWHWLMLYVSSLNVDDSGIISENPSHKTVSLQHGRSRRRTASTPSFCDVHILQIRIPQFQHHCLLRTLLIHSLTFRTHELLVNTRSRIPVSARAPTASTATAVPTFRGTAILLIVTHFSLSTPFDHHVTSTLTIVFGTAIPMAFHRA